MDRKRFIELSMALGAVTFLPGCDSNQVRNSRDFGKRLIIIRLNGGNDGLFSIAPLRNEVLLKLRPELYKPLEKGIPYINNWVINPQLSYLAELYQKGYLKIIPNVGYPNFNTSHFKSSEIWETGLLPGESRTHSGWIARRLEEKYKNESNHYLPIINLDDNYWLFDKGKVKSGFNWVDNQPLQWFENSINKFKLNFSNVHDSGISEEVNAYFREMNNMCNVEAIDGFSNSNLGRQLAKMCSIIRLNLPFQVLHAVQGGYDTHLGEQKRLSTLYRDLGFNIRQLVESLNESGDFSQTLVFIYSEFGRTVDENKTGGTDHGASGPVFLIGSEIDKMNFESIQITPSLELRTIGQNSYVLTQNDFRDIHKLIEKFWLI